MKTTNKADKEAQKPETLRRFKGYPACKDSGIEWLGKVPEGWPVVRLRFRGRINPSRAEVNGLSGDTRVSFVPMEVVCVYGGLRLEQTKALDEVSTGYTYFQEGDVVVAKITPCFENGKGSIAEGLENGLGFGTTELHVLRPLADLNRRFLFYVTISHAFRNIGEAYMYGAGGQKRVPDDYIRDFRHPVPLIDIQRAIAAFLDRETVRIDGLIEKKERQIELLQEKRTALISHAVTRGLNPDVKTKDSGIEWLGEVPEHWKVYALRRVAKRIQTGSTPPTAQEHYYENGSVPWYGPGSFGANILLDNPVKFIAEEAVRDGVARLFSKGSAMIVTIGATIGKVGHIDRDASCNQQITVVIFDNRLAMGKFGAYQLKRLEPIFQGIAPNTTLPIMNQQQVGDMPITLPSLMEQKAIVVYIDTESQRIEALVSEIRKSIEKLREYRTALISAAVTGKIDVSRSHLNV